jgi:hypothetical protein
MRRSYISPEFEYRKVFGTYNMREESTFFSSKMLEIEDNIVLDNQSIIYYQNQNKEQLDITIENSLPPVVYSISEDKKIGHTLVIDDSQNTFERNGLTKYKMEISLRTIFQNFLFATLKQYRTFEGVRNSMCFSNDVNASIRDYVEKNVIDRYKFDKIELYISYSDLRDQYLKRYNNTWTNDNSKITANTLLTKIQTETEFDYSKLTVSFAQEKSSQQYSFEYYYKLFWSKL